MLSGLPGQSPGIRVPGYYGRVMIMTSRRGLVVLVGCYQSKTMHNNNQVRGLCKFIGMLQTPTTLSDYKRNIYELKDIKKQAEN